VDLEVPVAGGLVMLNQDGIVEIASGLAVNGDDGQVAEVAAGGDGFGIETGNGARFGENFLGKDAGEMVLADDHLDIDAEVVGMAEDFDDLAARGTDRGGPGGDFDVDNETFEVVGVVVAGLGSGFFTEDAVRCRGGVRRGEFGIEGDDDGLGHPIVEGSDMVPGKIWPVTAFARVMEDPNDGGVTAGEDAEDAAEAAAVGAGRQEFDEHLVALHGFADFVGRDEDVIVAISLRGTDEAEAVAVQVETSGNEIFGAIAGGGVGS